MDLETAFKNRLQKLNPTQREAVETTEGPVLVLAGPGTGKTELLSLRTAHIIHEGLASASSILLLTFTDNASTNLRKRLVTLLGPDAYKVGIFTFHSFAAYILRTYRESFFDGVERSLVSDIEKMKIMETIFSELPYDNPFSKTFDGTYIYLYDTFARISEIKKGGYTAREYKKVVTALVKEAKSIGNLKEYIPEGRLSAKKIEEYLPLLHHLKGQTSTIGNILATTLEKALDDVRSSQTTESLSSWKKKYLATTLDGVYVKDVTKEDKLLTLSDIYEKYEEAMHKDALYDYDDMILEVAHALSQNETLRGEVESQYLYIMIDEFQDTNEAQMNLVTAITSSSVHEGRPNVLVVGDDDQAIYKFQGAEVSHMLRFKNSLYKDVAIITLTENYRSTQNILDLSRDMITQGSNRLETTLNNISKKLTSVGKDTGTITYTTFLQAHEEYAHIARTITSKVKNGEKLSDIAIIARKHDELDALIPYLEKAHIPYTYTKKTNILDTEFIQVLLSIMSFSISLLDERERKDFLLPKILTATFLSIDEATIIRIAQRVREEHMSWYESTHKESNENTYRTISSLFSFMEKLATLSEHMDAKNFLTEAIEYPLFHEYYFGEHTRKENLPSYVYYVSLLRTLYDALTLAEEKETLVGKDIPSFILLHSTYNIPLQSVGSFETNGVTLLTAHAAKGLEFDTVFVTGADDATWMSKRKAKIVPIPTPLSPLLEQAADDEDDVLRLFYVALTRAKKYLHISHHKDALRFLLGTTTFMAEKEFGEESIDEILVEKPAAFQLSNKELLLPLVKDYTMSVTHLHNFLSVDDGGPLHFLTQNLLLFPRPKNPSGVFGDAVHKVLDMLRKTHEESLAVDTSHAYTLFTRTIQKAKLPVAEEKKLLQRGESLIPRLISFSEGFFIKGDRSEVSLSHDGVMIGEAHIGGVIDLLREEKDGYSVYDYKTGEPLYDFDDADGEYEKIKAHRYKQQLIMYQLLLEENAKFEKPVKNLSLLYVEGDLGKACTYTPTEEEKEYMKKLIQAVYTKIVTCDFPDISHYNKGLKGILEFEKDLIKNQ